MNKNWKKDLLLLADFIPPCAELREHFDIEQQVERIYELGFNGQHIEVTDISEGETGVCFFKSEYALGMKHDMLKTYRECYEKSNAYDIIYINVHWLSKDLKEPYRQWFQLDSDRNIIKAGYGDGGYSCINSPFKDWAYRIVKDVGRYGVTGIFLDGPVFMQDRQCFCDGCLEQFEKEHGFRYTKENMKQKDIFLKLLDFKKNSIVRFLKEANEHLKSVNEKAVIFMNGAIFEPDKSGRNNRLLMKHQDALLVEGGFISKDLRKMPIWKPAASAKLGETQANGKPVIVALKGSHGLWNHYLHTKGEIWNNYAMTVSNGANVWFGIYDDNREDEKTGIIKQINTFLKANSQYLAGSVSTSKIALVWSTKNAVFYQMTREDIDFEKGSSLITEMLKGDAKKAFDGWFDVLQQSHCIFDVIDDYSIGNDDLSKYELVIFPNIGCMSDKEGENVKKFVGNGGNIIGTYDISLYDEYGEKRNKMLLGDVFGVTEVIGSEHTDCGHINIEDGFLTVEVRDRIIPSPMRRLLVKIGSDTEKFMYFCEKQSSIYCDMTNKTEFPFIISNTYGKGKAVLINGDMDAVYNEYRFPVYLKIMKNLVNSLSKKVIFLNENITSLFVNIREKEDVKVLHLVNHTSYSGRPIDEITELMDLDVALKLNKVPKKITALRTEKEIGFTLNDGLIKFTLSALKEYEILILEF